MKIKDLVMRPSVRAFTIFTIVYAFALAAIFWGTWSPDRAPVAPDCATTYAVNDAAAWLASVWAGKDFIPSDLMHVIGGMYFWQELQFALAAWLAALGIVFYLRGRGLSLVAAYGGGAAFGLMGYCFTLFSAGHLGWFIWMMYGPFAFGLVDRGVREGKWMTWALLGAVLAWASARQPDLWLLFTLLTFAYGVWCLVREGRTLAWKRVGLGLGVCALATLLVGAPQFSHAIFHDLAGREEQISASGTSAANGKEEDAATKARKAEERWLFCTSWSLPPEDTLEFAFAEIHGGSNDPRVYQKPGNAPYKGRLGQHGIVPAGAGARHPVTGQELKAGDEYWMPYRQHSLYFGLLSLLLAVCGVVGWIKLRVAGKVMAEADAADGRDVPFWIGAALVVYFCALGGFTPFYRLVYALPFGDTMRCPVKFVHLLEFCVAVLAGYGIEFVRTRLAGKGAWVVPALAVLAAVNVFDLARVDAKYLAVQDVSFARAPNEAAEDAIRLGGGKVVVTVPVQEGGQMIRDSLGNHLAETAAGETEEGVRFLLANGTSFQADKLDERLRAGKLKVAGFYSLSREGIRRTEQRGAALLLLEKTDVPAPTEKKSTPPPARGPQALGLVSVFSTFAVLALAGWKRIRG